MCEPAVHKKFHNFSEMSSQVWSAAALSWKFGNSGNTRGMEDFESKIATAEVTRKGGIEKQAQPQQPSPCKFV